MNTQEAYELMRVYLTRPGARRAIAEGEKWCAYETVIEQETQRCAVGCLLSPAAIEEINAEGFNGGIYALMDYSEWNNKDEDWLPVAWDDVGDVDINFLGDAQVAHDEGGNWGPHGFDVVRLDEVATDHGLVVVVDEPVVEREERVPAEITV